MSREFFKNLPDKTTPLNSQRMNGFFNGEEAMGSIVVDDISCKNLFNINNLTLEIGSINYSTGTITVNNYANSSVQPLKELAPDLIAGETYTVSLSTTGNNKFIYLTGSETIWFSGTPHAITQAELDRGIIVYGEYDTPDTTVTIKDIQIEKGTKASKFAPYRKIDNTEYVLYDNAIGNNDTITLKDSTNNYRHLEIYFFKAKELGMFHTKIFTPNGKYVGLTVTVPQENGGVQMLTSRFYIGENQITFSQGAYLNFWKDGSSKQFDFGATKEIYITRVVGYK